MTDKSNGLTYLQWAKDNVYATGANILDTTTNWVNYASNSEDLPAKAMRIPGKVLKASTKFPFEVIYAPALYFWGIGKISKPLVGGAAAGILTSEITNNPLLGVLAGAYAAHHWWEGFEGYDDVLETTSKTVKKAKDKATIVEAKLWGAPRKIEDTLGNWSTSLQKRRPTYNESYQLYPPE